MQHEYSVLVERLRETLARLRYNPVVLHNYCRNADSFLSYLAERKIALEAVTPTEVSHYLRLAVRRFRKRHGYAPARYWVNIPRAGIHVLLKLTLKGWPPEPATLDAGGLRCREVCDEYQTWRREERGLATASIEALMWEARNFCAWLIKHSNATGFANLTVRDVDIYMDMRAPGLARKSLKDVAERLRSLLKHLYRTGRTAADLSQHVIAPLLYAYEGIPSALSSDQISIVLEFVRQDRSPMGLRDYLKLATEGGAPRHQLLKCILLGPEGAGQIAAKTGWMAGGVPQLVQGRAVPGDRLEIGSTGRLSPQHQRIDALSLCEARRS